MLKVNYLTGICPREHDGIARYQYTLKGTLVKRGVYFNAICYRPVNNIALKFFYRYVFYPYMVKKKISFQGINHITSQEYAYLIRKLQSTTIVTVHDVIFYLYRNNLDILRRLDSNFYLNCLKKAKHIIAVSNNTKKDLIKYADCEPNNITVIHNGVNQKTYYPQKTFKKPEFFQDEYKNILYVGSGRPRKNLDMLIRTLHRITRNNTKIKLIIAGQISEQDKKRLDTVVEALKLRKSIIFAGPVNEEELPIFYTSADVFVFPSLYEGFGLPVLEAMACGCPVITSNTSSLPEVIGDAGIMVNPTNDIELGNAITDVLSDDDLRKNLAKKALRRAKYFSWEKTAEETYKLYKRVMEEEG